MEKKKRKKDWSHIICIEKDKYAIWNRIGHFLFEMNITNEKNK